jgi:hypothetical protein
MYTLRNIISDQMDKVIRVKKECWTEVMGNEKGQRQMEMEMN